MQLLLEKMAFYTAPNLGTEEELPRQIGGNQEVGGQLFFGGLFI